MPRRIVQKLQRKRSRLVAFRVTKVEVQAEADTARACLRLNEKIATKSDLSYGAFVRSEPALDGIVYPVRGPAGKRKMLRSSITGNVAPSKAMDRPASRPAGNRCRTRAASTCSLT